MGGRVVRMTLYCEEPVLSEGSWLTCSFEPEGECRRCGKALCGMHLKSPSWLETPSPVCGPCLTVLEREPGPSRDRYEAYRDAERAWTEMQSDLRTKRERFEREATARHSRLGMLPDPGTKRRRRAELRINEEVTARVDQERRALEAKAGLPTGWMPDQSRTRDYAGPAKLSEARSASAESYPGHACQQCGQPYVQGSAEECPRCKASLATR